MGQSMYFIGFGDPVSAMLLDQIRSESPGSSSSILREDPLPYRAGPRMIPVAGWAHAGEAEGIAQVYRAVLQAE